MEDSVEVKQRPLWRRVVDFPLVAMVIAVVLFILATTIAAAIDMLALPPIRAFTFEMKFDLIAVVLLVITYELVIRRLGEHPRDDYRDRRWLRHLLLGLGAGLAIFSLAVAIAAALGVYHLNGEGDLSGLLPAFIASALFPAVNEELLFRGILFRWIEEFGGSWAALLVTSALFGCAHLLNPHASPIAAVGIAFEAGVMLGAAYMLTRSLWMPMGLHAAWNFAQGEIYDIPVSGLPAHGLLNARLSGPPLLTGNGFGLEASIIAIAVATLFGLWLLWLAIRKGEIIQPGWVRRRQALAPA
ncbi:MAG TPA: type II CAAX endopeptidase family protein [Sphingomicrobium sp.]|nr:type II CAAX endopeptidase family protein [Sphingomicrobium sp.]